MDETKASFDYEENLDDARRLANMLHKLNTMPVPTIVRVQGAALGAA